MQLHCNIVTATIAEQSGSHLALLTLLKASDKQESKSMACCSVGSSCRQVAGLNFYLLKHTCRPISKQLAVAYLWGFGFKLTGSHF